VDIKRKDGVEQSLTREEFMRLELIDRDKIQSWTYKHDPADLAALESHISEYYSRAENAARIVSSFDLLETLNRSYMEQASNPYPDMLRIPQQAAKEMILGSYAPVYRLVFGKPVELGPKDLIMSGGLNYQYDREFGVKKADADGLHKWGEAVAGRLLPERQSSVKKNHGER
jgi:hypothetical protein